MYLAVAGACAEQKANAGGGGGGVTPAITIATGATGNFNNAAKFAFLNINQLDYTGTSVGVFDGSTSTFGTASSPTRTTQSQNISATDLRDNAYYNGSGFLQSADAPFFVGCYIRHNGSTISNPQVRINTPNNGLVSASMTNAQVVMVQTATTYANQVDSTSFTTGFGMQNGMHDIFAAHGGASHYHANIQLTGKSGNVPQAGDNFTIRITATATVDGTGCTAIHDLTITLT